MRFLSSPGALTDLRTGSSRTLRPVLIESDADLLRVTGDTDLAADLGYCTACWHPAAAHPVPAGAVLTRICPA